MDTLNSIVRTKAGTILANNAGLIFDDPDPCKCCNDCICPMPLDPNTGLPRFPLCGLCGDCTPGDWKVIVAGVDMAPCVSMNFPPRTPGTVGDWGKVSTGNVDGITCAKPNGAFPEFYLPGPCQWFSRPTGNATQQFWLGNTFCNGPETTSCGGGSLFGNLLELGIDVYSDGRPYLYVQVNCPNLGGYFYGETDFMGCDKTHVLANTLAFGLNTVPAGAHDDALYGFGRNGSVTAIPCCN